MVAVHDQEEALPWCYLLCVVVFILLPVAEAHPQPDTIVIEFSGVFDNCPPGSDSPICPPPELAVLLQTEFSGEVRIPVSENEAVSTNIFIANWPSYSERGIYQFALSDASFHLDTASDQFDLDGTVPPTIQIDDCLEGDSCERKHDSLRVQVEVDGYVYDFVICCAFVPGELNGVGIPDAAWISAAMSYGRLSISSNDYFGFVSPELTFPTPWVTSVSVIASETPALMSVAVMPMSFSAILCGITVCFGVVRLQRLRRASAT